MKIKHLLVDGYNMIFEWEALKKISKDNLEDARIELINLLCDYGGHKGLKIIVVFDAYKVKGTMSREYKYKNILVVYTKEKESADLYIEKKVKKIVKNEGKNSVEVATSDSLEQTIILSNGGLRVTARELEKEIYKVKITFRKNKEVEEKNFLINNVDKTTAELLNKIRLGK